MNYQKVYDQLVERAKSEQEQRIIRKHNGEYFEGHHIIPKCLGGTGYVSWANKNPNTRNSNIVGLTAREHYVCHWLLVRIYPDNKKIIYSFWIMNNQSKNGRRYINSRAFEEARILKCSIPPYNKGTKGLMVAWNKGMKGVYKQSEEAKLNRKGQNLGNKHSESTLVLLRRPKSTTTNYKHPKEIVTCTNCGKSGGKGKGMSLYHFDNCKHKI